MLFVTIHFLSLFSAALLAGAVFLVWFGDRPFALAPSDYVAFQQQRIRGLTRPLPILGAVTLLFTLAYAALARGSPHGWLVFAAMPCLGAGMLITRFANMPINAEVLTWSVAAPPAHWREARDRWWAWHVARTAVTLAALALLLLATLVTAR